MCDSLSGRRLSRLIFKLGRNWLSKLMIREAGTEDIPAIRRLMEAEPGFWQPDWSNETLAKGLDSADGIAFVWENSNEVLGFVCAHDVGFRGYLSELIVA